MKKMLLLLKQFHEYFSSKTPMCRKLNPSPEMPNDEFIIAIFIHCKPRIAVAILDL